MEYCYANKMKFYFKSPKNKLDIVVILMFLAVLMAKWPVGMDIKQEKLELKLNYLCGKVTML